MNNKKDKVRKNSPPTHSQEGDIYISVYKDKRGNKHENIYPIKNERTTIGSANSCDICIKENSVSNIHAILEKDDKGNISIYDMASKTGIFVNGKKVVSHEINYPDDEIQIGFTKIALSAAPSTQKKKGIPARPKIYSAASEYTQIDEKETIRIFKKSKNTHSLQIIMYWGKTILDVKNYVDKEEIYIGEEPGGDFLIPTIYKNLPFIRFEDNKYVLALTNNINGIIRSGKSMSTIDELRKKQENPTSLYEKEIKKNDLIKLEIKDITLFISFTPAPPALITRASMRKDVLFFRTFLTSLALTSALIVTAVTREVPPPLPIEELPPRITNIIFRPVRAKRPTKILKNKIKEVTKPVQKKPKSVKRIIKPTEKKPKLVKSLPNYVKSPTKEPPAGKKLTQKRTKNTEPENKQTNKVEKTNFAKSQRERDNKVPSNSVSGSNLRSKGARGRSKTQTLAQGLSNILKSAGPRGNVIKSASKKIRPFQGFIDNSDTGIANIDTGKGTQKKRFGFDKLGTDSLSVGKTGKKTGTIASGGNFKGSSIQSLVGDEESTEVVILGGLDQNTINEIIKTYFEQIRYCYEKQLSGKGPSFEGRVSTRFLIQGSGRVSRATVTSSSLNNRPVERCLVKVIKSIRFPKPLGGGIVEVSYPFVFSRTR